LIQKTKPQGRDGIRKTDTAAEELLRFSFRYFQNHDELCPKTYSDNYTQKLAERLKELSNWTVRRFITRMEGPVKNHKINWGDTARLEGFGDALPSELRESEAWQFSITRNEHGRVHGFFIGNTFYIVWLDCNHMLYSN
jgi:hypothetical protein